jgi:predicted S18 family serine protease
VKITNVAKQTDKVAKDEAALKKHYHKDISAEDEWSHVTGIDPKKTQDSDPMSPQERVITFTNKISNDTKEEIVKKKSEKFKDQVNNTDQYLRFVNGLIKEKVDKLRHLQDDEKKFQDEVTILQNRIKSRYEIDKLDPKRMTSDDARDVVYHLEEEFEKMKDRLLYQELIVQRTKDEIAAKRRQIQEVKDELKELLHKVPQEEMKDPVSVLREELKKAGVDKSNKIFEVLDKISEYLSSKDEETRH